MSAPYRRRAYIIGVSNKEVNPRRPSGSGVPLPSLARRASGLPFAPQHLVGDAELGLRGSDVALEALGVFGISGGRL